VAVALVCFFFSSPSVAFTNSLNRRTSLTIRKKTFSLLLPPYFFNNKLKETMGKVFPFALLQVIRSSTQLEN
jgi:hypothetical protein